MERGIRGRTGGMERLLPLFDVDPAKKHPLDIVRGWKSYTVKRSDGGDPPVRVILIVSGPKNIAEVKKTIGIDKCIVIFVPKRILFLRLPGKSLSVQLDGEGEFERVARTLAACNIAGTERTTYIGGLIKAIAGIPVSSGHFDNRGVFSNHYLRNRLWDDIRRDIGPVAQAAGAALEGGAEATLEALGWDLDAAKRDGMIYRYSDTSVVVVPKSRDLSVRTRGAAAPSYTAVAELNNSRWVILTNGREWRLYTSKVSASTTNYLGVDTGGGVSIPSHCGTWQPCSGLDPTWARIPRSMNSSSRRT